MLSCEDDQLSLCQLAEKTDKLWAKHSHNRGTAAVVAKDNHPSWRSGVLLPTEAGPTVPEAVASGSSTVEAAMGRHSSLLLQWLTPTNWPATPCFYYCTFEDQAHSVSCPAPGETDYPEALQHRCSRCSGPCFRSVVKPALLKGHNSQISLLPLHLALCLALDFLQPGFYPLHADRFQSILLMFPIWPSPHF
jgi:hypothetical protein